jgi:DNA-binding NarL/FixJ family response regulator
VLLAEGRRMTVEGSRNLPRADIESDDVAEEGRERLAHAKRLRRGVIVAEITMPHRNGIDALSVNRVVKQASCL